MFTAATVRILSTIYHFRFRFLFKDCFASFCFAFACRIRFASEPGQYSEPNPDSESDASHFGANVVVDTTSLDSTCSQIRFEKGLGLRYRTRMRTKQTEEREEAENEKDEEEEEIE